MTQGLTRRRFLSQAVAGTALAAASVNANPARKGASTASALQLRLPCVYGQPAELPRARGPRMLVLGGGWSGLAMAKYLKRENPRFDVVLIEQRSSFFSCPMSNLWLADLVKLEFLSHSYLDAARNNDYLFFNATAVDLDRERRRLFTEQGYLDYDYLVVAPGIDYDYAAIGVTDPQQRLQLQMRYPAAFMPGSEHLTLKDKVDNFDGGLFLLTVPTGNYRCLPAPYERACMVAAAFKRNRVRGKVLLLDANPDILVARDGFRAAFEELYRDYIEYVPSFVITGVDVEQRRVESDVGSQDFQDAAIYPPIRGAHLLERFGLMSQESPQKEARIDPQRYNLIDDERVYVTGDARPMPLAKTGHAANTEAHYVARVIARHAAGKPPPSLHNPEALCFAQVNTEPKEAIRLFVHYVYRLQPGTHVYNYTAHPRIDSRRDVAKSLAAMEWARSLYRDMFD